MHKNVEKTLNELLDNEAEEMTGDDKYERLKSHKGYRSGRYTRNLTTTSGDAKLLVPKLKGVLLETAKCYCRREARLKRYLAGVSARRV